MSLINFNRFFWLVYFDGDYYASLNNVFFIQIIDLHRIKFIQKWCLRLLSSYIQYASAPATQLHRTNFSFTSTIIFSNSKSSFVNKSISKSKWFTSPQNPSILTCIELGRQTKRIKLFQESPYFSPLWTDHHQNEMLYKGI